MDIILAIFEVFTVFSEWIGTAITAVMPIFYVEATGLTFVGALGVAGLAMSIMFLILGFIQNFLHFRG